MKTFFVESFGCTLNQSDGQKIERFLEQNGFKRARKEKAKLLVLNTCAVKQATEHHMVREAEKLSQLARKNRAQFIITGCLPKVNFKRLQSVAPNAVQFGPGLKGFEELLGVSAKKMKTKTPARAQPISIIPISNGCLNACAYCATKLARGNLKSVSEKEILDQIRNGLPSAQEFWLTATDCGAYGFDKGTNLAELAEKILQIDGQFRVRVGMLNPQHARKYWNELLEAMQDPRFFQFIHLPIQSGSNTVLKNMKRGYTAEQCLKLVERARSALPDATIATDIIVGFPGETEKQFEETMHAIQKMKPDVANISKYGARPGTSAARLPQVLDKVKNARSKKLSELCHKISLQQNRRMEGRTELVLVDEKGKSGTMKARTQNYKTVVLKKAKLGEWKKVRLEKAFPNYLTAKSVSRPFEYK
ncbi:MAG: tRNA (N(6)-L-threonylcarbamoyladenosine(37)-C(2))-methylthiotransferase [Candidatus Diapherotrites archaeon]